ncbi:LuxR C-terminal-related transcriptional regulator [Streptomyces sp. MN03-5084-2B]|nr:LuxR C-terminal-related transcriptional regulator [Streptomyces sp. MN03-5084-2B]
MKLFEREEHEALAAHLIAEATAARGQVLLLEGAAATGRTALLRQVAGMAERAGLQVVSATCSPVERELDGSVLSQLLHSDPDAGELADHAVPGYHEFCRQILRRAGETALLVTVDDAQHADGESLRSLHYLARRLGAARVLLVVTTEVEDGVSPSPFATELLGEPHLHRLAVDPLSAKATGRLLAEWLGDDAAGVAEEYHRFSGGNFALLAALAEDHRRDGVSERGYGAAVVRLLQRTDWSALRIARALAVLGARSRPDRVTRLAGLDRDTGEREVERAMAAMTASGLLRDGRFAHPAGRAAVLATVTGTERATLNQRAARLLHDVGEQATAVACHLDQAGRAEPWAVPVLVEVADQELLAERNERAARLLELAGESSRQPAEKAAILAKLSGAQWRRSPAAAARNLTSLVASAAAGHLDAGATTELVYRLLWHGRVDEATAVLDRLRTTAAAEPDVAAELGHLESWLGFTHPRLLRRGPRAVRSPVADAPATGTDPWLASAASLSELLLRGQAAAHVGPVEQTLHNLQPHGNGCWAQETASLALLALLSADRPDLVVEWCTLLSTPDGGERSPVWHARLAALRAEALLRRGELGEALRAAREALTLVPVHAWGVAAGFPLGTLVSATVRTGALDEAARYLAFAPSEQMFSSRYGLYYLHARGHYHLASERGYAALADFLACGDAVKALGLDAAATVPWRTGAAEAWLQQGNEDRARRLVRDQLARSDAAGGSNRGRSLRVLAAVSTPERRPQLLLEAVELFEECWDQFEQAQVLADLGCAYSCLGDSRRARTTLRRARHLAGLCEAAPLCDTLVAMQEQPEPPAPRREDARSLTESERRVAHLAVLGYTNREIAAKLCVTSSTVEQHLTRVFRKLDVKRRKDLPADLGTTAVRRRARRSQRAPAGRSVS